jgi:hypothetical protein
MTRRWDGKRVLYFWVPLCRCDFMIYACARAAELEISPILARFAMGEGESPRSPATPLRGSRPPASGLRTRHLSRHGCNKNVQRAPLILLLSDSPMRLMDRFCVWELGDGTCAWIGFVSGTRNQVRTVIVH